MNRRYLLFIFPALFALVIFAFAGCGGSDENNALTDGNVATGFASMKAGSWEEMTNSDGARDRSEFLGTDSYNGTDCYLMEFDTTTNGKKETTQIWISKSASQGVLMVMKDENGKVTKLELTPSTTQDIPTSDVPVNSTKIGTDKYTTPTGKTVNVTKYKITTSFGESEVWISSQVPFGQVKSLLNGTETSKLYDYGTSGAVRDISKKEMESASSFGIDDGGDGGDGGGGGIGGNIVITVGAGVKPQIKVSQPVTTLMLTAQGLTWGFSSDNALPGPFTYGVIPNGAIAVGVANPPDLKAGSQYMIVASDDNGASGLLLFVR
jgi:hypothetical protein